MVKDDRLYAFIVSQTSQSRSQIRRISIHPLSLKALAVFAVVVCCSAFYGFYGLIEQARHERIARENDSLREENDRQRQQLNMLKGRVEAVEDASRRLAEISGVAASGDEASAGEAKGDIVTHGAGGPALDLDGANIAALADSANRLERELHIYEHALRERAKMPMIWPATGELTDSFGTRHDPFGGGSSEFHAGQDIAAAWGTPVFATANGHVSFAGTQNGYGQVIMIDHGNNLTTRYAHLSKIEVKLDQEIKRGDEIGNVGSTGRSTGPHLHYEVRSGDEAVDPLPYMSSGNEK